MEPKQCFTTWKKIFSTALLCTLISLSGLSIFAQSPVEKYGRLQVQGNKVLDKNGDPVSLAGNSLFWSNAGDTEDFYNSTTVDHLANAWNSSIIRAAMGVNEPWDGGNGYIGSPAAQEAKIRQVIDAAIANGIYVIVDWHTHEAEQYEAEAIEFFGKMARIYGDTPNIIYEVYNEPINQSWSTIKSYSEAVINAIRAEDPDNLVVVGTPFYSQRVDVASQDPISDNNVAYTLHFYSGTHRQGLRNQATTALNNGVALFVTEWGAVNANGDGAADEAETALWMDFLQNNGISHANWAVSDKSEGASIVQPGAGIPGLLNDQLTNTGAFVKGIIENWSDGGTNPPDGPGTTSCNTIACIRDAMRTVQAGDEIIIESGTYQFSDRINGAFNRATYLYGSANGTSANPVILRGANPSNPPVIKGTSDLNGYLLSLDGDYWVVRDIEFEAGSKGVILDNASHCQLINLTVHETGDEGIHLRDGSSNNLVKNCTVYNTGRTQPGFGEGMYVGSDKSQHDRYNPDCDNNTIEGSTIGPNVTADGIDVKEGTTNTIIRNNTFSAAGITGANSGDAYIDLKGEYGFVYGNEFNIDGSTILASGIDILDRGVEQSGFRSAIFNNTFNFGSRAGEIPTVRKKQGNPEGIHLWNNTRIPASDDFPISDGTEPLVTLSCPSWNILPCDDAVNQRPNVSFVAPSGNLTVEEGYSLSVEVEASDADGTVSSVQLFRGTILIREEVSAPYTWGVTGSATADELNGLPEGVYTFKAVATDNDGATREATFQLTVTSGGQPTGLNIPGKIEAEDYNDASEGRTQTTSDTGGGLNVGWIDSGEFLEYIVDIETSGTYDVAYRVAALSQNIRFELSTNGNVIDNVNSPATGGWQTWKTVTQSVQLNAGVQTLRITATGNSWNINWFEFTSASSGTNVSPQVSITSPSGNVTVEEGYTLNVSATASDSDGTISYVDLLLDNSLINRDNSAPYTWSSGELDGLSIGTYTVSVMATDDDGATSEDSFTLTVLPSDSGGGDCNFNTPGANGIPSINKSFTNVHVLGTGGPALSNFREFTINWNAPNNGLYQFAFNTNNGSPGWYVNFSDDMTFQLQNAQPDLILSNTGFSGLDGSYWVALDGNNLALVSKTGGFTIYFSNESSAPVCNTTNARIASAEGKSETIVSELNLSVEKLLAYPNPSGDGKFNLNTNSEWVVFDLYGQRIAKGKGQVVDLSSTKSGIFMLRTKDQTIKLITH